MFGILRPCGQHTCPELQRAWMAHLCGLCLTLRDRHGQLARTATNYDGLLLSVLTEAQSPEISGHRVAGPCALRGFRGADVVTSGSSGTRLAAVVSLALAAGKIRDHAADGDGLAARTITGAPVRRTAETWAKAAERGGAAIGFDTGVLTSAAHRQLTLEAAAAVHPARTGRAALLELTEPTETASAAAFAHTAVLAGRPGNVETLREAGRLFGRIAHLVDAVEDLAEDQARGAFNPLTATGVSRDEARAICLDACQGIALAVQDLELDERHLVEMLLRDETRRAVDRTFGHFPQHPPRYPGFPQPGPIRRTLGGLGTFLTCGVYRPKWSRLRGRPCDERCYCCRCDCPSCDGADGCCDCCKCASRCDCDCGSP
ncbi:DUF5685 family protein [Acrocarpospora catenulata]|uniref:DUF5685 family protein n=1 Tax=Acrocarpospora catenulata TaxID=2836182 RepID=UPI001BDA9E46|nr:DUF5685 family protein [Acrocarpospora catenulata]